MHAEGPYLKFYGPPVPGAYYSMGQKQWIPRKEAGTARVDAVEAQAVFRDMDGTVAIEETVVGPECVDPERTGQSMGTEARERSAEPADIVAKF
jgi:hypothetical protein